MSKLRILSAILSLCLFVGHPETVPNLIKGELASVVPEALFSLILFFALLQNTALLRIIVWLLALAVYIFVFKEFHGGYGLGAVVLAFEFVITIAISILFMGLITFVKNAKVIYTIAFVIFLMGIISGIRFFL